MNSVTVTVRTLRGDLLELTVPPSVWTLRQRLYEALPEIPYGTLMLRHDLPEEDEEDESVQLARMVVNLVERDSLDLVTEVGVDRVTDLADGMTLFAFADETWLYSRLVIRYDITVIESDTSQKLNMTGFLVEIVAEHDDALTDGPKGDDVVASVVMVRNDETQKWALLTAFDTVRAFFEEIPFYTPAADMKWYASLSECYLASEMRLPRDSALVTSMQRLYERRAWTDPEYPYDAYHYDRDELIYDDGRDDGGYDGYDE